VTRDDWLAAFAARLGVEPPDAATVDLLLRVAGAAAHGSERTAAPIACWLLGVAGADAATGLAAAEATSSSD
jgi:hypothetical protein